MDISAFEPISHEEILTDIRSVFLGAMRMTLELLLEEELREFVGVGRWQKALARKDLRNGSYTRQLMTFMGHLEVAVPRTVTNQRSREVAGAEIVQAVPFREETQRWPVAKSSMSKTQIGAFKV